MELTDKEIKTIQTMLQEYREHVEEVYSQPEPGFEWDGDESTLFTEVQRRLFTRFDVVSIRYNK